METRNVEIRVSTRLDDSEWENVRAFNYRASRLSELSLFKRRGASAIRGSIKIDQRGLSSQTSIPSDDLLAELFLVFRHFILEREPANFLRVISILRRRAPESDAQDALAWLKQKWQDALFQGAIRIGVDGENVTAARILDLWFNGEYFHGDVNKRVMLDRLHATLGEPLSKYMLVDAVYNGVLYHRRFASRSQKYRSLETSLTIHVWIPPASDRVNRRSASGAVAVVMALG